MKRRAADFVCAWTDGGHFLLVLPLMVAEREAPCLLRLAVDHQHMQIDPMSILCFTMVLCKETPWDSINSKVSLGLRSCTGCHLPNELEFELCCLDLKQLRVF